MGLPWFTLLYSNIAIEHGQLVGDIPNQSDCSRFANNDAMSCFVRQAPHGWTPMSFISNVGEHPDGFAGYKPMQVGNYMQSWQMIRISDYFSLSMEEDEPRWQNPLPVALPNLDGFRSAIDVGVPIGTPWWQEACNQY